MDRKALSYWLVQVDFLDHCHHLQTEDAGLVPCSAWGILIKEDAQSITLCSWYSDEQQKDLYRLLKHPGMKITKIKKFKVIR